MKIPVFVLALLAAGSAWVPKLPAPAGDNIAYRWLPWLATSPCFSRAAQVPAGTPLMFIGGLDGGEGDARA